MSSRCLGLKFGEGRSTLSVCRGVSNGLISSILGRI
uniref:Uncharacterized protein n=1 Tax=Anguilla anguilla TaxID=7936 RepID=A0A0E9XC39_ANGAN